MDTSTFISYRRSASTHLARNIFTELNKRGIDTFLDVEKIDSTQFDTFIMNQIAARSHFVLLLSQNCLERCVNDGDWLLREIEQAHALNRNIIPIYDVGFSLDVEKKFLPPHLQEYLPSRNAVPYTDLYYNAFIDRIIQHIKNVQDHEPIVIKPAPQKEAEQATNLIKEALAITYDDTNIVDTIGQFYALKAVATTSTDWQDLLQRWGEIRASGRVPEFFNFDESEKEVRDALTLQLQREKEEANKRNQQRAYEEYTEKREKEYVMGTP